MLSVLYYILQRIQKHYIHCEINIYKNILITIVFINVIFITETDLTLESPPKSNDHF